MQVIGHRGAAGLAYENTLPSVAAALQLGVDVVEVDVQLTADGVPVLFHDRRLDARTNGGGRIAEYTHTQLSEQVCTASGERIPTLAETCALIAVSGGDRTGLMAEILTPAALTAVLESVRSHDIRSVYIASFFHSLLAEAKRLAPEFSTVAIWEGELVDSAGYLRRIEADIAAVSGETFSDLQYEELRRAGVPVFVWTVNQPAAIREFITTGVDGIISDYPDRVIAALST